MRKTKEEAQITKEKIIQASYEIIQEKGYEQMTRDDIAAKVGMTRGAVNWHFSSKEDIYLAALHKILKDFKAERQQYLDNDMISPEEKLENLFLMPIKMREKYRFINGIPEYLRRSDERFSHVLDQMAENRKNFIVYIWQCLSDIEERRGRVYKNKEDLSHILYFLHEGLHANHADSAFEDRDEMRQHYKNYLKFLLEE